MSLAACASKLPVIIGMVSADHTEVGERVLQPRQQRREQWAPFTMAEIGLREAPRLDAASVANVDCRRDSSKLASPVTWDNHWLRKRFLFRDFHV